MRCTVLAVVLLSASAATAQTLHNNPNSNIFDTFDPRCDGSDPSIVFCDGFEDGEWVAVDDGHAGTAGNDYWAIAASFASGSPRFPAPDPRGTAYTECGTANSSTATFGAAGTPCTGTQGWAANEQHGVHGAHWITTQPGDPNRGRATGTSNYYIRFYFKESGITSTRCPGGAPNCPSFAQNGSNGYKAVEVSHIRSTGGIEGAVLGTLFASGNDTSNMFAFGMNCYPNSGPNQRNQNQGNNFDHRRHRDEWIYAEYHIVEGTTTGGTVELWMDACGRDGTQCTGTPTLRTRYTGLNMVNTCGPGTTGQKVRALWNNWWNTSVTGEIQTDEFVVRDGEVRNSPIGFLTPLSGTNPNPVPPPTPLAPPVLLPIN